MVDKLEKMLAEERGKTDQLIAEGESYKGKIEYLIKRKVWLEEEIARLKAQVTRTSPSGIKARIISFFKPAKVK